MTDWLDVLVWATIGLNGLGAWYHWRGGRLWWRRCQEQERRFRVRYARPEHDKELVEMSLVLERGENSAGASPPSRP